MTEAEYDALSPELKAEAEARAVERAKLEAEQARVHYDAGFRAAIQMADSCITNALRLDPRNPPQLPIAQAALMRQMVLEMHYLVGTAGQIMQNLGGIGAELNAIVESLDALGEKPDVEKVPDPTTLAEVFKEPVAAVASAVTRKGKAKATAKPA